MSVGVVASVAVPVVTAAAGYGGRVLHDWHSDRVAGPTVSATSPARLS